MFLLDSADHDRLQEARTELQKLLTDEVIAGVPIAVVANKTDLPVRFFVCCFPIIIIMFCNVSFLVLQQSLGRDRLVSALGLEQALAAASSDPESARPIEVFRCSLILNSAHEAALQWLANQL